MTSSRDVTATYCKSSIPAIFTRNLEVIFSILILTFSGRMLFPYSSVVNLISISILHKKGV
jgi:hypothetical protein